MEADSHVAFIWSAYGVTAVIVAGLVIRAVVDHRIQRRALARLEERAGGWSGANSIRPREP